MELNYPLDLSMQPCIREPEAAESVCLDIQLATGQMMAAFTFAPHDQEKTDRYSDTMWVGQDSPKCSQFGVGDQARPG